VYPLTAVLEAQSSHRLPKGWSFLLARQYRRTEQCETVMRQQLESAVLPQFVDVPQQVQQLSPHWSIAPGNFSRTLLDLNRSECPRRLVCINFIEYSRSDQRNSVSLLV
jgi:hypothetical protein